VPHIERWIVETDRSLQYCLYQPGLHRRDWLLAFCFAKAQVLAPEQISFHQRQLLGYPHQGEPDMAIELNHTVVPARDKVVSATFFAKIFGLVFDEGAVSYFAPVKVNDSLTLDFADASSWSRDFADRGIIDVHHYAFKVSEAEFDLMFERLKAEGIPYGSEPNALDNMDINHRGGGRGVYFRDPDGHILELLTAE
jgi:catechol 2,3-dioxygenase-like lactoylglutathione lyase family enzyme